MEPPPSSSHWICCGTFRRSFRLAQMKCRDLSCGLYRRRYLLRSEISPSSSTPTLSTPTSWQPGLSGLLDKSWECSLVWRSPGWWSKVRDESSAGSEIEARAHPRVDFSDACLYPRPVLRPALQLLRLRHRGPAGGSQCGVPVFGAPGMESLAAGTGLGRVARGGDHLPGRRDAVASGSRR